MENKKYLNEAKQLRDQLVKYFASKESYDNALEQLLEEKQKIDGIAKKIYKTVDDIAGDLKKSVVRYEHNEDIRDNYVLPLIRQGKSTEQIIKIVRKETGCKLIKYQVAAYRAHESMETYNQRKRNKQLTYKQEKALYKDLKSMSTKDSAAKYGITRARANSYLKSLTMKVAEKYKK